MTSPLLVGEKVFVVCSHFDVSAFAKILTNADMAGKLASQEIPSGVTRLRNYIAIELIPHSTYHPPT